MRAAALIGSVFAAAELSSARLLDTILLGENTVEKRATNNTVIPAPIQFAPSQYWDGNDGPW